VTQEATRLVGEGFDAYIAKVNAAGGVHGERIKVVFREDQYQAEPALAAARELIDKERAVALVNTIGSLAPSAMAKDGVLKRNDVALIGPVVGAPAVLSGANTFPIRADYDAEFALMTRHIEQMRWERVAYLHFNIGVAPGYAKYIADQAKSRGLSFTGAQGFDVVADPAVQAGLIKDAIAKLMEGKPQAVIVFSAGASQAVAMKALKEQGVQRYTISVNTASGLVKGLGQEDARGIIITQAVPAPAGVTRRVTAEYLRDLRQFSPHATPNYYSMEGYLTARVLTEALRRAGPKPSSASVLRALNGMGRYDMGDFAVDYGPTRKKVDFTLDITAIGRDGNLVR
jgi:ABC-type branched-subunit amino acid transport system substrate-binding protein